MKLTIKHSFFKRIYIIAFLILTIFASSCRKDIPSINEPNKYKAFNYSAVFESFWSGLNNNYVFWDVDQTDWDKVYEKYKPLFAKLNINDDKDHQKAYDYFVEMTAGLSDSHLGISSSYFPNGKGISPSNLRQRKKSDYHDPISNSFFYNTIPQRYLDLGFSRWSGNIPGNAPGELVPFLMVTGNIKNDILYLHFSGFSLMNILGFDNSHPLKQTLIRYLDQVTSNKNWKGLIIDLRANGGGSLNDLDLLVGTLTDKPFTFGATHYKSGLNRLDYTPWIEAKVHPNKQMYKAFTAPIVVLADLHSISMAEMSTMALKNLPSSKATFVGERTWGGQGPLTSNMDIYNGGQFTTDYFNIVYTSSVALRYLDGINYEGIGFPPDIEVKYNQASLNAGTDLQLEKAISLISK